MLGAPGTLGTSPTSPGPGTVTTGGSGGSGGGGGVGGTGTSNPSLRCVAPTGSLSARKLGPLALGMTRTRARHLLRHYSTRRKLDMDFYCQRADDGIRAFYPSAKLLRTLPRKERKSYAGKIMVALTAGPRYALHAVHAGTRLTAAVRRRLHTGRAYHVGKNFWYVTPNGTGRGCSRYAAG